MARSQNTLRRARSAYVFERRPPSAIAIELDVSVQTVRRWKRAAKDNGDDWDVQRGAHIIAGAGMQPVVAAMTEEMVLLGQSILKQIKADDVLPADHKVKLIASLSDALAKGVASAGRAAPKLNEYAIAQDVIKRLADFTVANFPEHGDAIVELLEPFGAELAEAYSQ